MRVLVLTNMYPPHSYGGYEQSCRDVVARWRARGHEVEVLTSTVRVAGAPDPAEPGVERALQLYWDDHEIVSPPYRRRWAMERHNERVLRAALDRIRPDVVSAWAMGAMSFGLMTEVVRRGLPLVSVVCDEWPVYGPVVDAWLRPLAGRPRLARLVAAATGLAAGLPPLDSAGPACFVSAFLRDVVRRRSPWTFPDAAVVHSGIDLDEFPVVGDEPGPWGWRLLYVGRIDPRKGIDTVVRALARCPAEATLEVHGQGDERHLAELRASCEALGLGDRVQFTVTPRAELAAVYRRADVLVFPSVWEEPFGLVPIEAMASATPVVATLVGGAAEFLDDGGNCLAFAPGDDEALAGALARLADAPDLRARLVDGGRRTAREFTADRLADVLEGHHRSAMAAHA